MNHIEFPIAVFGGIFANVSVLRNIINICQKNKVKTLISLGNTIGLGDPKTTLELVDKYVDIVIPSEIEKHIIDHSPLDCSDVYRFGINWTKRYFSNTKASLFLSMNRELTFRDFFFSTHERFSDKNKDFSEFKYLFFYSKTFKIRALNKNGKSFFHIPDFLFVSRMGEFIILKKKCFHIVSIPIDVNYILEWCKSNISEDAREFLKTMSKYNWKKETVNINKCQTFKYTDQDCKIG